MDEDGAHIRKDESYEKNYLIGKYGAIPTLKSIKSMKSGEVYTIEEAWQEIDRL